MNKVIERFLSTPVQILGLMSGTSLDGLDIALVRWQGTSIYDFNLMAFQSYSYDTTLKDKILSTINGTTAEVSSINFELGNTWASFIRDFLQKEEIESSQITGIASHGQTIWHESGKSTLQVGESCQIAETTGIPVISNFRERDISVGGTGAPLIPYLDWLLFNHMQGNSLVLNIGGIANVTCISSDMAQSDVRAWDTGPGNMVVDSLIGMFTKGDARFDENGKIAHQGTTIEQLLEKLLFDEFVCDSPPKSTGREYYSEKYIHRMFQPVEVKSKQKQFDLIRTTSEWTIAAVSKNVEKFWCPSTNIDRVIVSGGGAYNDFFMERLASHFINADILKSSDFGIPVEAKEAVGFAVLGKAFIDEVPANMPAATGAHRSVILGKLTPS